MIIENPAKNTCRVAPVLDRGPWFNVDDYWNPANQRFVNKEISGRPRLSPRPGLPCRCGGICRHRRGWGTTKVGTVTRGNTNLKKNGVNYPVTFQTSIDIGDGRGWSLVSRGIRVRRRSS